AGVGALLRRAAGEQVQLPGEPVVGGRGQPGAAGTGHGSSWNTGALRLLEGGARTEKRSGAGRRRPRGHRVGSKGRSSVGVRPVAIARASSRPVIGPCVSPHMPCPPAAYSPGTEVAPISGRPSAVTGRGPTHSSLRADRSTPSR